MPDLDIVTMRMCRTNEQWVARVKGSNGNEYEVSFGPLHGSQLIKQGCEYGWTCTCKGFKFRGGCSHIQRAEKVRCGWHEQWGRWGTALAEAAEADPDVVITNKPESEPDDILEPCPECGGPTRAVRVGV